MRLSGLRALLFAAAWAALGGLTRAAQVEGPLDNDAYLPINEAAQLELARGDQALVLAQRSAGDAAAARSAWTSICEAWRNALLRGRVGEASIPRPVANPAELSPWPDAARANERFTQGLEAAVLWRLAEMPAAGRAAWRERFDPLAREALERAGDRARELEALERELPATAGAARAALLLAELAFERGESAAGSGWLRRCRQHLKLHEVEDPSLLAALERREQRMPPAAAPAAEIWRTASTLEFVVGRELEAPRGQSPRIRALGSGPQAGMQVLSDERELLQTPAALWLLDAAKARVIGPFENNAWLDAASLQVEAAISPGDGPGWRLDPAAQGSSAVVVVGRSVGETANVLACVDFSRDAAAPQLIWALAANDPKLEAEPGAESEDELEFQPGPLWRDGLVIVLRSRSRAEVGEREIELLALEPQSAKLRWRTFLGKGGERSKDLGRFARRGVARLPAEPLLAAEAGVFASTQLGFASLVDTLDGRLRYTLRNRRRETEARGWTGWGASLTDSARLISWAPGDADHLYVLDAADPPRASSPLIGVPHPMGEAEALVEGGRGVALLLSRAGARRSLARWDLESGSRQDALRLGPEEVFAGRALASAERVLACSDRALYLFDREHDLMLMAAVPLRGGVPRGGNVWARGSWVFVLSNRTVEIFKAR